MTGRRNFGALVDSTDSRDAIVHQCNSRRHKKNGRISVDMCLPSIRAGVEVEGDDVETMSRVTV